MNATPLAQLHWPVALIVEDELLIRCDLADCLRDAGWMVMETPNADQAMALCKDGIVVHVLITDIQLDGSANGWDVAEAFRASSSDVAVIYTTGNNHDRKRCVPNSLHFTKPYQPKEVVRACKDLVARGGVICHAKIHIQAQRWGWRPRRRHRRQPAGCWNCVQVRPRRRSPINEGSKIKYPLLAAGCLRRQQQNLRNPVRKR